MIGVGNAPVSRKNRFAFNYAELAGLLESALRAFCEAVDRSTDLKHKPSPRTSITCCRLKIFLGRPIGRFFPDRLRILAHPASLTLAMVTLQSSERPLSDPLALEFCRSHQDVEQKSGRGVRFVIYGNSVLLSLRQLASRSCVRTGSTALGFAILALP
jgi:hypothetical protein